VINFNFSVDNVEKTLKIGIMGGTFDPVHIAHLAIAELAVEQLKLDKLLFVPARIAPHKTDKRETIERADHRYEMLKLATRDNNKFNVSNIEFNREGTSYTIDTLEQIKKEFGGEAKLFLLIGSDNYLTFNEWREPERIHELAEVTVYSRPGSRISKVEPPFLLLKGPGIEITSTWIRDRILNKKSIRYFLPENVKEYIYKNKLYNKKEE